MRESGSFSYRNAIVAEIDDRVIAGLIGYPLPDRPEPIDHDAMPAMFVPLQELENLAPVRPELVAELRAELAQLEQERPPLYSATPASPLSRETEEALRQMGYLE